jgi:hypothetical protein
LYENAARVYVNAGNLIHTAHVDFGLQPVAQEVLLPLKDAPTGQAAAKFETAYAALAVVRKEACIKPDLNLADFQGRGMCSTGYRRIAGWSLPL